MAPTFARLTERTVDPRTGDSSDGFRASDGIAFSEPKYISSNASQYFFLCGELLKERQMAFRKRSISMSSMIS